jgi:hypothetical protein
MWVLSAQHVFPSGNSLAIFPPDSQAHPTLSPQNRQAGVTQSSTDGSKATVLTTGMEVMSNNIIAIMRVCFFIVG